MLISIFFALDQLSATISESYICQFLFIYLLTVFSFVNDLYYLHRLLFFAFTQEIFWRLKIKEFFYQEGLNGNSEKAKTKSEPPVRTCWNAISLE